MITNLYKEDSQKQKVGRDSEFESSDDNNFGIIVISFLLRESVS